MFSCRNKKKIDLDSYQSRAINWYTIVVYRKKEEAETQRKIQEEQKRHMEELEKEKR